MSVLASRRSLSKFEVIVYASEVRHKMQELAERDFGLRNYDVYSCRYYSMEKGVKAAQEKHRKLLDDFAYQIRLSAMKLTANVRAANSIYPNSMAEYEQRRSYQNRAIANCEELIGELQHIIEFFDVDINIFKEYVKAIDREIGLIKDWRRSDNKFKSKLKGNI